MRDRVHTKNDTYLSLVTSPKAGLTKLRVLALKNRYQSHNHTGGKIRILTGIYRKQRNVAEMKTCRAVEKYRQVITDEINAIFEVKEDRILLFVHDLLKKKSIENVDFTGLVSEADLQEISLLAGRRLAGILTGRFGINSVKPFFKTQYEGFSDEMTLLEEWFKIKQRTVFVSEQVAKWSNKAWGYAVDNLIADQLLAESMNKSDFGNLLLARLGVSPALEKEEMFAGLVRRVQGIVINVKMRIVTELHAKGAEIIYGIHDEIIDRRLEDKIDLLDERMSEIEVYQTERV